MAVGERDRIFNRIGGERVGDRLDKARPLLQVRVVRGWSSGVHGQVGKFSFPTVADL